jgi:hypothetical protein
MPGLQVSSCFMKPEFPASRSFYPLFAEDILFFKGGFNYVVSRTLAGAKRPEFF